MQFKATEQQVKQIMANAVNASRPMGLGMLHFDEQRVFAEDDFKGFESSNMIHLDYVEGRMVKLTIKKLDDGLFELPSGDIKPRDDYQSWAHAYPTYQHLVDSVLGTYSRIEA